MSEENDLLNFFNKQDKLKTAAPTKKPAAKKEEPAAPPPPEVKEPQKPTKAVQDLRALREAKEKSEAQEVEQANTPEEKKAFVWSNTPPQQPKNAKKDKDKKPPIQPQAFPTLKQAMSGEAYQLNNPIHNLPTVPAAAPPPLSNAFTGLEDELVVSSSDEEGEDKKKEKKERTKKPKNPNPNPNPEKPKDPQAKKTEPKKPKQPVQDKPKKKSQTEEDVDKLMAEMGLSDKPPTGKKKGGKKK
eukprot:Phypoly_transcript_15138.p1 GENE.Phypoly_transcript_15138~~Phypoly_transcript_15138.p1  ORF type:complete len:243 (+),score=94.81 Phypoly_transcript_15138:192-920(+)